MGTCVCMGAMLQCTFGLAPSTLLANAQTTTLTANMIGATIMDNKPMGNISPFGMCNSMANPTVASATAVAFGVLTPMPCVPVIAAPWAPGSPTVLIGGYPALNNSSQCMCNWGGVITVTGPGQFTVSVP